MGLFLFRHLLNGWNTTWNHILFIWSTNLLIVLFSYKLRQVCSDFYEILRTKYSYLWGLLEEMYSVLVDISSNFLYCIFNAYFLGEVILIENNEVLSYSFVLHVPPLDHAMLCAQSRAPWDKFPQSINLLFFEQEALRWSYIIFCCLPFLLLLDGRSIYMVWRRPHKGWTDRGT